MGKAAGTIGALSGLLGMGVCSAAGITRLMGEYYLQGYEAMSVFMLGMGLLLAGVFLKLYDR